MHIIVHRSRDKCCVETKIFILLVTTLSGIHVLVDADRAADECL